METASVRRFSFSDLLSTIFLRRSSFADLLSTFSLRRSRWAASALSGTDSHNLVNRCRYANDMFSGPIASSADRPEHKSVGMAGEIPRRVFFVHAPKSMRGAFAGRSAR
jgi:hypothetical protein